MGSPDQIFEKGTQIEKIIWISLHFLLFF